MEDSKVVEEPKQQIEIVERKNKKTNDNALDQEIREIRIMELEYEKDTLKKEVERQITEFDLELSELSKEKYRLESDIKQAEMKLIIYYEELIQLNGMEERDNELTEALAIC